MTKLVQHDVEEFQQMRGQRRKLTKALFVISMLKPMSDDSRNFPLIVVEAFKDILCDFREARTRHGPWRPIAWSPDGSIKTSTCIPAHINLLSFPRLSMRLVTQSTSSFLREVPPTNVCQLFLDGCQRLLVAVRIVMKVFSQVSTIPGGPEKQKLVLCCSCKRTAAQYTILSYLHTNRETVIGELHNRR